MFLHEFLEVVVASIGGEVGCWRIGAVPFGIEVLDGFPVEAVGPEVVVEVEAVEGATALGIDLLRPDLVGGGGSLEGFLHSGERRAAAK